MGLGASTIAPSSGVSVPQTTLFTQDILHPSYHGVLSERTRPSGVPLHQSHLFARDSFHPYDHYHSWEIDWPSRADPSPVKRYGSFTPADGTTDSDRASAYNEEKEKHMAEVNALMIAFESFQATLDDLKHASNESIAVFLTRLEANRFAYLSASKTPSAQSVNIAEGFRQYFEFEYPELADKVAGSTNSDLFLWFMASDGPTAEAHLRFEYALYVNFDREVDKRIDPIARFDTPVLSLEGYLWLRNFERFNKRSQSEETVNYELKNMRMEQIAWNAIHMPQRINPTALEEFNELYAKAHEIDERVPDFAVMKNGPRRRHAGIIEDVDDFPAEVGETE